MNGLDFLLIGLSFGTLFGLLLSILIDRFIDYRFKKESQQMNMKITDVKWLTKNDKE